MATWRLDALSKDIIITDSIFGDELNELSQYACHEAPYVPAQFDNKNIKEQRPIWINRFPSDIILSSPVWQSLNNYYKKKFQAKNIRLDQSYLLASQSGDVHYYHQDAGPKNNGKSYTSVTYLNKQWNKDWAGETLFEKDGDLIAGVIPKYGRTVIFEHCVNHTTRPPSINCLERRFVLVTKVELEV